MPGYPDGANNQEEDKKRTITGRTIQRGSRGYESLLSSLVHRQPLESNYVVITHYSLISWLIHITTLEKLIWLFLNTNLSKFQNQIVVYKSLKISK